MAEDPTQSEITDDVGEESVRKMAESVGISALPDETVKYLAQDATYRLKQVVQESTKFMYHGKRQKLTTDDIDHALKVKNIEPMYGFQCQEYIPFRMASGGGREIHFTEEKEFDLNEFINAPLPKVPQNIAMKAHWLCIDGEQPSVPENPPAASIQAQKQDMQEGGVSVKGKSKLEGDVNRVKHKVKGAEKVQIKTLLSHELSVEQQLYYKEITEACVGSNEERRGEALNSLTNDPGLHQMLPRFCTFISEGVKVNVVQNNLALLIYLMRMVRAVMDNSTLYLDKYLHDLVPAITTCIVSKQLCLRPETDNHWALRDFAARIMSSLCRKFNTSTNGIQTRATRMFTLAIHDETTPLATHYGAIVGLGEMGEEVIKTFLCPLIKSEGERIKSTLENLGSVSAAERKAAEKNQTAILKFLPLALKVTRPAPDVEEEYVAEFGYLGKALCAAVQKERSKPTSTQAKSSLSRSQTPSTQASVFPPRTAASGQKYIVMTSQVPARPTSSGVFPPSAPTTPQSPQIVKVVQSGATPNAQQPAAKITVVTMATTTPVMSSPVLREATDTVATTPISMSTTFTVRNEPSL